MRGAAAARLPLMEEDPVCRSKRVSPIELHVRRATREGAKAGRRGEPSLLLLLLLPSASSCASAAAAAAALFPVRLVSYRTVRAFDQLKGWNNSTSRLARAFHVPFEESGVRVLVECKRQEPCD